MLQLLMQKKQLRQSTAATAASDRALAQTQRRRAWTTANCAPEYSARSVATIRPRLEALHPPRIGQVCERRMRGPRWREAGALGVALPCGVRHCSCITKPDTKVLWTSTPWLAHSFELMCRRPLSATPGNAPELSMRLADYHSMRAMVDTSPPAIRVVSSAPG